jgi:hypothetical protein
LILQRVDFVSPESCYTVPRDNRFHVPFIKPLSRATGIILPRTGMICTRMTYVSNYRTTGNFTWPLLSHQSLLRGASLQEFTRIHPQLWSESLSLYLPYTLQLCQGEDVFLLFICTISAMSCMQ